jgi:hypothetical protein
MRKKKSGMTTAFWNASYCNIPMIHSGNRAHVFNVTQKDHVSLRQSSDSKTLYVSNSFRGDWIEPIFRDHAMRVDRVLRSSLLPVPALSVMIRR